MAAAETTFGARAALHGEEEYMVDLILVTGAAGRVGAIGRTVTELLLKQGKAVRAKGDQITREQFYYAGER